MSPLPLVNLDSNPPNHQQLAFNCFSVILLLLQFAALQISSSLAFWLCTFFLHFPPFFSHTFIETYFSLSFYLYSLLGGLKNKYEK